MDISRKTWKYLHGPDDIHHLSFSTGGVPRSFSVVRYSAMERDEIDLTEDGIAIIDNDNMRVVLDGHLRHDAVSQMEFQAELRKMSWASFAQFCDQHPRFRGGQQDFDRPRPLPGVLINQIQRGVMHAPSDASDLRSPSMIAANADPACPYSFPAASRSRMLSDILQHDCHRHEGDGWRLGWTAEPAPARPADAGEPSEDERAWIEHCAATPELRHQATGEALEGYFSGRIGTWPRTDAGRYDFTPGPDGDLSISLLAIEGSDMSFASRGDFGRFLDALPDDAIRDIWKLVRVVDRDLAADRFGVDVELRLETFKAEFQAHRAVDTAPQVSLE